MRRTILAAAAGGLGVAAANRLLAHRAGQLPPALDGTQRTTRWRGLDIAYAEAGDPSAQDVLLLHSVNAAGSSREFAGVFDALAANYHVVAPDLPGFGRSDRPAIAYSARLYESFVADFAREVTDGATCVASSLTGAYAAAAADEGGFSRLLLVCPTAETATERRPWLRTLLRTPLVGTALFNALVSRPALRQFDVDHAYANSAAATEDVVDYQWRTAHQPGARFAPAAFVAGELDPEADLGATLASLEIPVTFVWGREADGTPLEHGRELAERADARLVVFDESRLLPHDEYPEEFLTLLDAELPLSERQ